MHQLNPERLLLIADSGMSLGRNTQTSSAIYGLLYTILKFRVSSVGSWELEFTVQLGHINYKTRTPVD